MGFLSSSVSITRYKVQGTIKEPVMDTIASALTKAAIPEIEDEVSDKVAGWTSFEHPYRPNFEGSSYRIGPYVVFTLRIDRRTIPPKIVKKQLEQAIAKQLAETGQSFLSRNERQLLKEQIIHELSTRIPAVPHLFDIVWNLDQSVLWFFSTQKAANEELETLFSRTFGLSLIRMFPYAQAHLASGLSDPERDRLSTLSPTRFSDSPGPKF